MTAGADFNSFSAAAAVKLIRSHPRDCLAGLLVGAARIALGVLWLHEGWFKYHVNFGRADILLVVGSVDGNTRVDPHFRAFVDFALHGWPSVFGFIVPSLETILGVALILGVLTLPVAAVSLFNLMNYWSADQLTPQYPVMGVLSVVVVAFAGYASLFSATSLTVALAQRLSQSRLGKPAVWTNDGPMRRWL
jgi:thiosulfate dehydrogenase [quinone] large subunit